MKRMRIFWLVPMAVAVAACAESAPLTPGTERLMPAVRVDARGAVTPTAPAPSPTIVDVALQVNGSTGEFSTLIAAALRAGVASDLSARGQRTVFAPTDAAFAALGLNAGNIDTVPVEALTGILLYHVTPGRREASSVVGSDRLRMANGGTTTIEVRAEGAFINEARIIATDVEATNGIIHVIDGVLIP
jgi:uncharacterized surface protein with fasciclin (FAS1) repeats